MTPAIRVVGVEAAVSCAFTAARAAGRIVPISAGRSLADGLGGNVEPETLTWDYIRDLVDEIVTVTEPDLAEGLRGLVAQEHLFAEGAGVAAVAAVAAGAWRFDSTRVAVVVSGVNIDAHDADRSSSHVIAPAAAVAPASHHHRTRLRRPRLGTRRVELVDGLVEDRLDGAQVVTKRRCRSDTVDPRAWRTQASRCGRARTGQLPAAACSGTGAGSFDDGEHVSRGRGPPNAGWPVSISYSTSPSAKRSLRASPVSPSACSGDR